MTKKQIKGIMKLSLLGECGMKDIEIAQQHKLQPITEIVKAVGLTADDIEQYGPYKAKIKLPLKSKAKTKEKLMVMIWNIKQNFKETGKDTEKHNIKNVSIIGTISVVLKKLMT